MMSPSTKVFATLSLSAAVGSKIKKTSLDPNLRGAGLALEQSGFESTAAYPFPQLKKSKINQAGNAVEGLLSKPMEPQEILSMLIAGLVDIQVKCNKARYDLFDAVIYPAQLCLDLYPGEIDHDEAFQRYEAWCAL